MNAVDIVNLAFFALCVEASINTSRIIPLGMENIEYANELLNDVLINGASLSIFFRDDGKVIACTCEEN